MENDSFMSDVKVKKESSSSNEFVDNVPSALPRAFYACSTLRAV